MSIAKIVNGTSYDVPETNEKYWGEEVTNWMVAVSDSTLQLSGGSFPLTAEVDFGNTYGLLAEYFKSGSANISTTGVLRLSNTDGIGFRNSGNSADYLLKPSTDALLQYNGVDLVDVSATQTLTNKTLTNPVLNGGSIDAALQGTIDHVNLLNIGSNTHAQIDAHIASGSVHLSATPTKGNILVGNGSSWVELGVGIDTQVVTADAAEATGVKWAAGGGGATILNALSDVVITTPADNQVLAYDSGSGNWINQVPVTTVVDLSDTVITSVQDNEVLAWDSGSGKWTNQVPVTTLGGLSDVGITTAADNDVLAYDSGSGNWINQSAAEAGLSTPGHTHIIDDLTDSTGLKYFRCDSTGSLGALNGTDGITIGELASVATGGVRNLVAGYNSTCSRTDSSAIGSNAVDFHDNAIGLGYGNDNAHSSFQLAGANATTTNAAQTILQTFRSGSHRVVACEVFVTAYNEVTIGSAADIKVWKLSFGVKSISTVPSLVGSITKTVICADTGASAWDVTVTMGTAAIDVKVTGEAGKTIYWAAQANIVQSFKTGG